MYRRKVAAYFAGTVAVAAVACGVWRFWLNDPQESDRPPDRSSPASNHGVRTPGEALRGIYEAEAFVTVSLGGGVLYDARLDGSIDVGMVIRDGTSLEAWVFDGALTSGSLTEAERAEMEPAFEAPFLVKRSALGQVEGIYCEPRLERVVQTTWRALVLETQFRGGTSGTWETVEWDNNGKFSATYTASGHKVNKVRSEFLAAYSNRSLPVLVVGETRFQSDRGIAALNSVFELKTSEDMVGDMSSRMELALKRTASTSKLDTASVLARLHNAEFVSLSAAGTATSVQEEHDRSAARGYTWETALAGLLGDKTDRGKASMALVALMRLQPDLVDRAVELIRREGPLATKLIHRLGQASSEESLAALAAIADEQQVGAELRHTAITAMGFVAEPTEAMIDWLGENLDHERFSEAVLLSYGSAARRMGPGQAAQQEEIANQLVEGVSQAHGEEKEHYLAALGNAGVEQGLPALESALESESEAHRSQAALSLRHVEGAQADFLLAEQLESGSRNVKHSALRAMGYRSARSPLVEALATSMVDEASSDVRGAAVSLGIRWAEAHPTVLEALQVVAENDVDPSIRQAARNHLGWDP